MKSKIILFLLIPLVLSGQDNFTYDTDITFGDNFTDEFTSRRNGSTPTDVVFSSGVTTYNGSTSKVERGRPTLTGAITVVARINPTSLGQSNGGRILENGNLKIGVQPTNKVFFISDGGTQAASADNSITLGQEQTVTITRTATGITNFYVDGILSGTGDQGSGTPARGTTNLIIGNRNAGDRTFDGDIDYIHIYSKALTASEVLNLYNGVYYTPLDKDWLFDVDARLGVIQDNEGNTITNTSTTVFKHNNWSTPSFDGADSKLGMGYLDSLKGDISVVAWVYAKGYGEGPASYGASIIENEKTRLAIRSTDAKLRFLSDGATSAFSANNSVLLKQWYLVVVTRNSAGDETNFYINGVANGSLDQDSGTPEAGTANITIGNNTTQTVSFDGFISRPRVGNFILTEAEISRIYSSEKRGYE